MPSRRRKIAELTGEQLRDENTRQVVETATRADSISDQLATAQRAITAAEKSFRLAQQRREFGVGIVLETVQAEQELTRSRADFGDSRLRSKSKTAARNDTGGGRGGTDSD